MLPMTTPELLADTVVKLAQLATWAYAIRQASAFMMFWVEKHPGPILELRTPAEVAIDAERKGGREC